MTWWVFLRFTCTTEPLKTRIRLIIVVQNAADSFPARLLGGENTRATESTPRVIIVGGGAAGLTAAYTLRKYGIRPLVLEASAQSGGRLRGDEVEGFHLDTGADFFCTSYETTFRLCRELDIPLTRSKMNIGWFRNGRWARTTPGVSPAALARNLAAAHRLGLLSPKGIIPTMRLYRDIRRQAEALGFGSPDALVDIEDQESLGEYLARIGVPETLQTSLKGFLQMTMGDVESSGQAYMRAYIREMGLNGDKITVPEKGAGALANALAAACAGSVRLNTPVREIRIEEGKATRVALDGEFLEADAVICAVPGNKVANLIPRLPAQEQDALKTVTYSTGCRVVIGLERPPLPEGWHGALYPEDDTPLLLDRSINLPHCFPVGRSSLDLMAGRERSRELIKKPEEEIARLLLEDARRNPLRGRTCRHTERDSSQESTCGRRLSAWASPGCSGQCATSGNG